MTDLQRYPLMWPTGWKRTPRHGRKRASFRRVKSTFVPSTSLGRDRKPRVLACDKWTRVADNIAAIAGHIEAIRAVDRYGVGTLEQAFAGYAQLPANTTAEWWTVFGVEPTASLDEVEDAYRRLARAHHPDAGGSHEGMARLNEARDRAREALQ